MLSLPKINATHVSNIIPFNSTLLPDIQVHHNFLVEGGVEALKYSRLHTPLHTDRVEDTKGQRFVKTMSLF